MIVNSFLIFTLLVPLFFGDNTTFHVIESTRNVNLGTWGNMATCPANEFAQSVQVCREKLQYEKDDSSVNAIRLKCGLPEVTPNNTGYELVSMEGPRGDWDYYGDWRTCNGWKYPYFVAYQIAVEFPQHMYADNTATNAIRLYCLFNQTVVYPNGTTGNEMASYIESENLWGEWYPVARCMDGFAICGIKTQAEVGQDDNWRKSYDDYTGVHGVQLKCCQIDNYDGYAHVSE